MQANMLERLNENIRQRTRVARIFPNEESCLRLVTAVLLEIHEDWISGGRYLNMNAGEENARLDMESEKESVKDSEAAQAEIMLGLSPIAVNA